MSVKTAVPEGMVEITCENPKCRATRIIQPQDKFQVRFCKPCQKDHRNQLAREKRAAKRKEKEAKAVAKAATAKKNKNDKGAKKLKAAKAAAAPAETAPAETPALNSDQVKAAFEKNGPAETVATVAAPEPAPVVAAVVSEEPVAKTA